MNTKTREQSREVVLALLRAGDARALLAAALIVVTLALTAQTGAGALEDTGRTVLYVGAPSVSVSSAREAGAISRSYAETASLETLLALGFSEESASRYALERALASVTDQPADPDETITAQAALEAGAVYLAQTGTRPPEEADHGSEGELASAGPVRPELGDGTVALAEDLPADDTSTKKLPVASNAGDGGDLAYAGGPPDTPVAAYPGTSEDDPATLYPWDPTSGGEEPLELVSSFPTGTSAGGDFPEEELPAELETGPISAEEQVPTTLAGGQMEMPSSQPEPANEPADGGEELAVVPEEDAANAPIEATAPRSFPGQEYSTIPSVEEPDEEQSPATLLAAEPTADEEAPSEASTPDSGEEARGEATVAISISQEQTAEEGLEDDAREQVVTIAAGGEPSQGQDFTVTGGEVQNETPRPDTAEPADTTRAPPETEPEQETPPAEDAPDEAAPGENRPPDRQDDRASTERPASGPEANDPRGNSRGGAVTSPPGGRRGNPVGAPAGPEDGPEDRDPAHGGPEASGRAPRDDVARHPRRPINAPETMPRQPRVLSDRGTRRPEETPAGDGAHAARETTATFEPTSIESEIRGHGRGSSRAGDDGAPDAPDIPTREEDLD
jgi:hypothetical protein